MITQELINYINQSLQSGMPKETVFNNLIQAGWAEVDVNEAFSSLNNQQISIELDNANVQYAGFWVRFSAVMLDSLILTVPMIIIEVTFGILTKNQIYGNLLGIILFWTYVIYMLSTRQATLGKMAVGLKVTTSSGDKPSFGKIVLRETLGKIASLLIFYIGYIMIPFTKKKQGLHDMIADTIVIYDPARKKRKWLVVLGIVWAFIIPVTGIIAGVILVSTNTARNKAQDAQKQSELKFENVQKQINASENNINQPSDVTNPTSSQVATATTSPNFTLLTPMSGESYKIGDTIHISWTPNSPGVQNIKLILANDSGGLYGGGGYDFPIYTGYNFDGVVSGGSPVITNGYYDYVTNIESGSYFIEINYTAYDSSGKVTASSTAMSKAPITITN